MEDIAWHGWLKKRGKGKSVFGSSNYQDRYFLVNKSFINYYEAPKNIEIGKEIYFTKESELLELGFESKGKIIDIVKISMSGGFVKDKRVLIDTKTRQFDILRCSKDETDEHITQFYAYLNQMDTVAEDGDFKGDDLSSMERLYETSSRVDGVSPSRVPPTVAKASNKEVRPSVKKKKTVDFKTLPVPVTPQMHTRAFLNDIKSKRKVTADNDDDKKDKDKDKDTTLLSRKKAMDEFNTPKKAMDEFNIQTMYKMAEDIEVNWGGRDLERKVLYLTNKQANMFNDDAIMRCIQALELGKPKCIIRLLGSYGGRPAYSVHGVNDLGNGEVLLGVQEFGSDICKEDCITGQQQLELFMKNCVLPLAKQTKALIIAPTLDCSLAAALVNVVLPEQTRLGKNCPFSVLCFVGANEIHLKALKGEGLAGQVAKNCIAYASRMEALTEYMSNYEKRDVQANDILPAATHIIIFENFDLKGRLDIGPVKEFQAKLMVNLSKTLPSICFKTHAKLDSDLSEMADLIRRDIPILLLDTRERAISQKPKTVAQEGKRELITKLSKESNAFPEIAHEDLVKFPKLHDGSCSLQAKRELLNVAYRMLESQFEVFEEYEVADDYFCCSMALIHSALTITNMIIENQEAGVPLNTRIHEMMQAEAENNGDLNVEIPLELAREAAAFLLQDLPALYSVSKLKVQENRMLEASESGKAISNWPKALDLYETLTNRVNVPDEEHSSDFLDMVDILTSSFTFSGSIYDLHDVSRTINSVVKIDRLPKINTLEQLLCLQYAWDQVDRYHDFANMYKVITKASYFAILLFATLIAVFVILLNNDEGQNYECQYTVLALSMLITAVTGYINFINPAQRWQKLRGAAHAMESEIWKFRTRSGEYRVRVNGDFDEGADERLKARVETITKGVLEGADLKSTAFYAADSSSNNHAQHKPGEHLLPTSTYDIKDSRAQLEKANEKDFEEGADEIDDSWFGNSIGNLLKPFRYVYLEETNKSGIQKIVSKNAGLWRIDDLLLWLTKRGDSVASGEIVNSHYLPVLPNDYVHFRIEQSLKFYKHRIPLCNATRHIVQLLSTVGSVLIVIFVFLNIMPWTIVISIVTTSLLAWVEFQGTNNKIGRYSSVVDALDSHRMWWQTLSSIEKSATENIDTLVLATESILSDEVNAWRSSSANQYKLLSKGAATGEGKREKSIDHLI